jgi:hypothetical protein
MLLRHVRSREHTSTHSEPGFNGDELRCTGSISVLNMMERKIFISS